MTVGEAKDIARQWVEEQKGEIERFHGAFFAGSINFKSEDELWEEKTSDVDIHVLIDGEVPKSIRQRKLSYHGIILEPSYENRENLMTPEQVLSSFTYAYHFTVPSIISDPSGHLSKLQEAVERDFAKAKWVKARFEKVYPIAERMVDRCINDHEEGYDSIKRFGTFLPVFIGLGDAPLIADLKVPTLRRIYVLLRELMDRYDQTHLYNAILDLGGFRSLSQKQVFSIHGAFTEAFDRAVQVLRTPVGYDFNLQAAARPYIIDGTRQMIENGQHREIAWFIMWVFGAAIAAIQNDAPKEEKAIYVESYQKAMNTLGFTSEEVIIDRAKKLKEELLPEIMEVAEYIIENNPDVIK
jgi:hypothetical protein